VVRNYTDLRTARGRSEVRLPLIDPQMSRSLHGILLGPVRERSRAPTGYKSLPIRERGMTRAIAQSG